MSSLAGTSSLIRLALRRDRVRLPVWLLGLTGVVAASAASVAGLYDTEEARLSYATTTAASAVARAFNGPTSGASLGAITMVETYATVSVLAALMSIFAVVRHTRQNEETGRAELVGAGVVGRYALLAAAVTVTVLANLALAVLIAAALVAVGLPLGGSGLAGAAVAAAGISFTAVAAVTAQLAQSTRAATGLAAATLGVAFLARAVGDAFGDLRPDGMSVRSAWPSWLSPLGWGQQVRPFDADAWWLFALPVCFAVVLSAVACALVAHRDLGAGMLPVRRGPANAAGWLAGPLGLAWRLQRGALAGWAVGVLVTGALLGAVADEIQGMTAGNDQLAEVLRQLGGGGDLVDAYLAGILGIWAIAIGGYLVQALLRPYGEESGGHLEPVLATAVTRTRWLLSHVAVAVTGAAVLLVLTGAAAGLAHGLAVDDVAGQVPRLAGASLAWLPATCALGGFVVAAFGVLPRLTVPLAWAALAVCLLVGQIGALLDLPQAVLNVSPYTHVPAVPVAEMSGRPLALLSAVAVALGGAGLLAFRRRDIAG